jgi:hypothetical protein
MSHLSVVTEHASPASFERLDSETVGAAVRVWGKLEEVGSGLIGVDVMFALVVCITLAVANPIVKAADMPEQSWQAAQARNGNCQSDCQWNAIRCLSDCSIAGDTSHFKCDRDCASSRDKCIEGCSRRESPSKVSAARNGAKPVATTLTVTVYGALHAERVMKEKEKLLSFETPLKFVFSHSALRDEWDNPNVFQICALRDIQT